MAPRLVGNEDPICVFLTRTSVVRFELARILSGRAVSAVDSRWRDVSKDKDRNELGIDPPGRMHGSQCQWDEKTIGEEKTHQGSCRRL